MRRVARAPAALWTEEVLAHALRFGAAVDSFTNRLQACRRNLTTEDVAKVHEFVARHAAVHVAFRSDPLTRTGGRTRANK